MQSGAGHRYRGGGELLHVTQALCASGSSAELGRSFDTVFRQLFDVPMYGLYICDEWTGNPQLLTSANISDAFLARYEREGRAVDTLNEHLSATRRPAYNIGLMSMQEWLEHPLYRNVKRLHDIRHEIDTPIVTRDGIVGTMHFATSDPCRGFTPHEVRLADALGRVIATAVEGMHYRESLERERDEVQVALELTGIAVAIDDPAGLEPILNGPAKCLLAEVVDGETQLHELIARPAIDGDFTRHCEVALVAGGRGFLHARSTLLRRDGDALITVLELQRDGLEISERTLVALTPREREVALHVVDGLSDREIAERLCLSRHTISQHVRRIYRKLDVDSRVALTRLLLDPSRPERDR